jgi:hypothetical protein
MNGQVISELLPFFPLSFFLIFFHYFLHLSLHLIVLLIIFLVDPLLVVLVVLPVAQPIILVPSWYHSRSPEYPAPPVFSVQGLPLILVPETLENLPDTRKLELGHGFIKQSVHHSWPLRLVDEVMEPGNKVS